MSDARSELMAFLEKWKPFAEMAPGHAARRGITRLVETDDPEQRRTVLARVSQMARLHLVYEQLGIRKPTRQDKSERIDELLRFPVAEMARVVREGEKREFLGLLQEVFDFGRFEQEPRVHATRQFLLEFFALPFGRPGIKYSIYPNGVPFTLPGATHDEMAHRFNKLGLGSGRPSGGGEIVRDDALVYAFDTATTAFGSTMKPEFVTDSLQRWIRQTGGDEEKIALNYRVKLGVT